MLEAAVGSSGLGRYLPHVIWVDAVRTYRPAPEVYALGPSRLGIPAGDLLFVSSNAWDVAGAKAFGYRVAWCNRGNAPEEELGSAPTASSGRSTSFRHSGPGGEPKKRRLAEREPPETVDQRPLTASRASCASRRPRASWSSRRARWGRRRRPSPSSPCSP